jgi:hypothetical protein
VPRDKYDVQKQQKPAQDSHSQAREEISGGEVTGNIGEVERGCEQVINEGERGAAIYKTPHSLDGMQHDVFSPFYPAFPRPARRQPLLVVEAYANPRKPADTGPWSEEEKKAHTADAAATTYSHVI